MNSRTGLQILVLLFVAAMWDFIALRNDRQCREIEQSIGEVPVLIYSFDQEALAKVAAKTAPLPFHAGHRIDLGDRLADDLIQRYGLQSASPILKRYALPSLLRIDVKGSRFGFVARDRLWKIIHEVDPGLVIDYNEDLWRASQKRLIDFRRSAMMFDLFAAIVFLLAVSIMRWVLEHRQGDYWRVYARSGGDRGRRRRRYWGQAFLMTPVVLALSIAGVIAARFLWFAPNIDPLTTITGFLRLFALQAGTLLLAQFIGAAGLRVSRV
jgi:hypothetical protein